jgi:hypothetical protein
MLQSKVSGEHLEVIMIHHTRKWLGFVEEIPLFFGSLLVDKIVLLIVEEVVLEYDALPLHTSR